MTQHPDEECPVDCPIVVLSNDENINAEVFAGLTVVGWGANSQFVELNAKVAEVLHHPFELEDLLTISFAASPLDISKHVSDLVSAGIEKSQMVLLGPTDSLSHRTLAHSSNIVPADIHVRATGPEVILGDVVQVLSDRVFARLTTLIDEEVGAAYAAGSVAPMSRLAPRPAPEDLERMTGSVMIAAKLSHRRSFRRRVIRAALFRDIVTAKNYQDIIKTMPQLWTLREIFNEIALASAALADHGTIPRAMKLESWCVVASEMILRRKEVAKEQLYAALQDCSLEVRVAMRDAVAHAMAHIERWTHDSAS